MDNQYYDQNNNKINVDGYYYNGKDTLTLLTDSISSKSFDGNIPKITKEVLLYNKYTGEFNIKVGQEIGIQEYDEYYRYYTILKIYTDSTLKYSGKLNAQDSGVEGDDYFPEFTSDVFIEYLRSDGEILTYVIKTTLTDGFPDNLVQVSYEDWDSKSLGSSGWAITSQGNSIFNNVAVRGSIEAVSGNFSGSLSVNSGEMKIGAGISAKAQYTVSEYSSLNDIVTLTLSSTHPFQVGDKINVSSLPSIDLSYIDLNGTYTVTAIDTYTVSYDFEKTIHPVYDATETIIRAADIPSTAVTSGYINSTVLNDGLHINDYNYWHSTGDILIGDPDSSFSWNSTTNQLVINGANVTIGSAVNIEAGVTAESLTVGAIVISNNSDGLGNPGIYLNENNYWYSSGNFLVGDTTLLGEGMMGNPAAYIRVLPGDRIVEISGLINAYSGRIGASPYGDSNVGWAINEATLSSANGNVGLYSPTYTTGTAGVTGTSGASTVTVLKSGLTDPLILPLVGMSITGTGIAPGAYISSLVDNPTNYVLTLSSANTATVSGTATYSEYAIYAGNFTRELSPFKVDYSGNLSATSGVIGGWKIGSTSLTAGASATSVGMNTTGYPFYAGNATPASAPFRVTSAGALTATSATITGTINASGGWIGGTGSGWLISTNKIYNGRLTLNAPSVGATPGTGTVSGTAGNYTVTLTSPTIVPVVGMSITGTGIAPGAQINTVSGTGPYTLAVSVLNTGVVSGTATLSEIAIWAGATTSSSVLSPFRVDYAGNLYADSATIAGTINATGGTFTNKVIIGGAITGSLQVGTGTNKINIFGNNTDGGTYINTGTTTASTGSGFYFDASGRIRIAGTDSLTFDGTTLTITGTINANAGGTIGGFTMGATSLYGGTTPNIVGLIPGSTTAAIFAGATSNTGTGAVFKVTNAGVLTATGATIGGTINASAGNFTNTVYVGNNATAGNNIHLIGTATNTTTAIAMGTSGVSDYNVSTTKFWADASGRFSLGQNLTWDGTALTVLGAIKATSGFIGNSTSGWSIGSNLLSNGNVGLFAPTSTTGTGTIATRTNAITAVTASSPSAGFATYTATGHTFVIGNIVTITGASVAGYNGTFTITGTGASTITVANATTGTATFTSGLATGQNILTLTSPTITPAVGMSITGTNITTGAYITALSGAGPYIVTVSSSNTGTVSGTGTISNYAIYAGNATRQLAPFKIDYSGNLTATNANISGAITATSGTIGGFIIPITDQNRLTSTLTQLDTGIKKITLDSTVDTLGINYRTNLIETTFQSRPDGFGDYSIDSAGLGFSLYGAVNITQVVVSGTAPNKTIVYTVDAIPSFVSGDSVTITGLSGTVAPLNTMDVVATTVGTTTVTITNYNTSIANATYTGQFGTMGSLRTPYLIADSTAFASGGSPQGYIFTSITSDVGLEYGSDAGPNIILGKTRLGDVGLSTVSAIDGSADIMRIQPGGGESIFGIDGFAIYPTSVVTAYGGIWAQGSITTAKQSNSSTELVVGGHLDSTGYGVLARNTTSAANAGLYVENLGVIAGTWQGIRFLRSLTAGGALSSTGVISVANSVTVAPVFAAGSDYRLKDNIVDAEDNFIDIMKALRPVRYDEVDVDDAKNILGFIAHEVQLLVPEAVEGQKDAIDEDGNPEYQTLAQAKFVPYLIGALKQSIEKIEELEKRLAALES